MCDCNESPFNKLRESWSRHFDKESHNQCACCCQNQGKNKPKVKGKFGVAYVIETPSRKCKPCGWEVEFNDTPSQIESNCRKMMNWITCPPLGECQENRVEACFCSKPPEIPQMSARCCCKQQTPKHCQCCCSSKKPVKKSCCCSPTPKNCHCKKTKKCLCKSESETSTDDSCCCSSKKCCDNKKKKNQSTDTPKEEKTKQSKNSISPPTNTEKIKTPPPKPLATLNQQPKKEPDKVLENLVKIPEPTPKTTAPEEVNKENKPPQTNEFPLPQKRKKIEPKELLKLIKEGKKDLEAIRPTS